MIFEACAHCGEPNERERSPYCSKQCAANAAYRRKQDRFKAELSKIERLAIAGAVAPAMRAKRPARKITVVDKEGNPLRQITDAELAQAVLVRAGIELTTETRTPLSPCEVCGGAVKAVRATNPPKRCAACKFGKCSDCGAPLLSNKTLFRARKTGKDPLCRSCARARRTRATAQANANRSCLRCGKHVSQKSYERQRTEHRKGRDVGCAACRRPEDIERWWKAGLAARGVGGPA